MKRATERFDDLVESGEVVDGKPLPMVFSLRELHDLYVAGRIYEIGNRFFALVD